MIKMYEKNNPAAVKSANLAIKVVKLYRFLTEQKQEFIMSKQVLRSGTSIGANVKESLYAQSKADFLAKINIALKEAAETEYWLELLLNTEYITREQFEYVNCETNEIIRILLATVKTIKTKQQEKI